MPCNFNNHPYLNAAYGGGWKRGARGLSNWHSTKWYFFKKDWNTLTECSILYRNRSTVIFTCLWLNNAVLWLKYSNLVRFEAPLNQNYLQLLGHSPDPLLLYCLSPPHLNYLLWHRCMHCITTLFWNLCNNILCTKLWMIV